MQTVNGIGSALRLSINGQHVRLSPTIMGAFVEVMHVRVITNDFDVFEEISWQSSVASKWLFVFYLSSLASLCWHSKQMHLWKLVFPDLEIQIWMILEVFCSYKSVGKINSLWKVWVSVVLKWNVAVSDWLFLTKYQEVITIREKERGGKGVGQREGEGEG